jgi:hypothetical protein
VIRFPAVTSGTVDAAVIATTGEAADLALGLSFVANAAFTQAVQVDPVPALGGHSRNPS